MVGIEKPPLNLEDNHRGHFYPNLPCSNSQVSKSSSLNHRKGGGWAGSSLDYNKSKSNNLDKSYTFGKWSKKQKRGYHRIQSCLRYWQAHGYQVLWVTLTTAEGGDASRLAYHHQILRQRIERHLGYKGLQHFQVQTTEGNGVLHIFWAWKAAKGFRQRPFWVSQAWLSSQWQDIHGAPIVWIKRVKGGRRSRNRLSRYCICQYVTDQSGYKNMSWSWKRTFGFPLVRCWQWFKRHIKEDLLQWWDRFMTGGVVYDFIKGYGVHVNLQVVRAAYSDYRSDLWSF